MRTRPLRRPDRRVIRYMEWAKLHSAAGCSLVRSGVECWPARRLRLPASELEITGDNFYGYRPLLKAVAERYDVEPDQVATAAGTSEANFLACAVLLRAGDEVLVETPGYEPLSAVPQLLGAKVRTFPRRFENGYRLDLDEIAGRMTSRTRLILISNLHNPSGALIDTDTLGELGRLARRRGVRVLVDEVYLESCFQGAVRSSVHLGDNFVVTSSLTKVFGLDGLRCGWILCRDRRLIEAARRREDFLGVNAAFPADLIAVAAFAQLDEIHRRRMALLRRNFQLLRQAMTRLSDSLEWVEPDGGTVCFPRLRRGRSARALVERLRKEYDTAVVPGFFFQAPRHLRIGFGVRTAVLRRGLANLAAALGSVSRRGPGRV